MGTHSAHTHTTTTCHYTPALHAHTHTHYHTFHTCYHIAPPRRTHPLTAPPPLPSATLPCLLTHCHCLLHHRCLPAATPPHHLPATATCRAPPPAKRAQQRAARAACARTRCASLPLAGAYHQPLTRFTFATLLLPAAYAPRRCLHCCLPPSHTYAIICLLPAPLTLLPASRMPHCRRAALAPLS